MQIKVSKVTGYLGQSVSQTSSLSWLLLLPQDKLTAALKMKSKLSQVWVWEIFKPWAELRHRKGIRMSVDWPRHPSDVSHQALSTAAGCGLLYTELCPSSVQSLQARTMHDISKSPPRCTDAAVTFGRESKVFPSLPPPLFFFPNRTALQYVGMLIYSPMSEAVPCPDIL